MLGHHFFPWLTAHQVFPWVGAGATIEQEHPVDPCLSCNEVMLQLSDMPGSCNLRLHWPGLREVVVFLKCQKMRWPMGLGMVTT